MENLHNYEWELTKSPAGKSQYQPVNASQVAVVPDAHDPAKKHAPFMLTTDLSLRMDPQYATISRRFLDNPADLEDAFAKAWFKLLHRDMGPRSRYLGPLVPAEPQLWQDPVPDVDHELINDSDAAAIKASILETDLSVSQLVSVAWASASSYRGTDKRGGANGARVRLAPQKDWEANDPADLAGVIATLEGVQSAFNAAQSGGKRVSLADVIVLAGAAGVEWAAKNAGHDVTVPFSAGRTDAAQEWTDEESFAVLEPAGGRLPQLRQERQRRSGGARREGVHAEPDRAGDDGAGRRHARTGRKLGRQPERRVHGPPGLADQRLLREPPRHEHAVVAGGQRRVRGPRRLRHRQVDGHRGRPGLRLELGAPRARRGLRMRRRGGGVRERLRGGVVPR